MSIKALQDYTFYSRYARHLPEKKRRETYREETVPRVFGMHRTRYATELANSPELNELFMIAEKSLANKSILGSQRALQFGGQAILSKNERIYNCSSGHIDRPRAFQETLYLLLCGVGVGFSTQYCHVNKLPKIKSPFKGEIKSFVVEDSIEGWADAVGVLMSAYFMKQQPFPEYYGYDVVFDYSKIRPAGSTISWGGIAPGPAGLEKALVRIKGLLNRRLSKEVSKTVQMPPIDCYDILMHVSDAVLSGGIRRSACINLFSPEDKEMTNAKTGDWHLTNPQRARSNNSALLIRDKVSRQEFAELFKQTREFGEPGFVWAEHENVSVNPCVEIGMWPIWYNDDGSESSGFQFCNLTEINGKKAHDEESFLDACKAAAILGTLQAGYASFPYMGAVTENITKREALLGVSITGMMDNPEVLFNERIQRKGAREVRKWNRITAELIGINPAARACCVKPSGSASCILGTSSGIHPHHSKRYLRRVQANKFEFPLQHFKSINPEAVEESIWSANGTDDVITFLCEVPDGAKVKNNMSALELLEHVKLTQQAWVEEGTDRSLAVRDFVRNNVSNTITVKEDEWHDVEAFIYRNRKFFAGISLLPFSGDKIYDQAPFAAVYTPLELVKMYGDASMFASGMIVDAMACFKTLYVASDTLLGFGEILTVDRLRDRIEEHEDYGREPFVIKIPDYYTQYKTIELTSESSDDDLALWLFAHVPNIAEKLDWVRRGHQFAQRYFKGDLREMTYCLKDVSLWKTWCDLSRTYKDVDWVNLVEETHLIKVDEMGAQACSGGQCEL